MAKDYFQDIVPSGGGKPRRLNVAHISEEADEVADVREEVGDRSIRNVHINPSRPRRNMEPPHHPRHHASRRGGRRLLWIVAGVSLVALAGLLLVAFRPTTVTITPRSNKVVFDETSRFTAYPVETATEGTLSYAVKSFDLDDSDTVSSAGVVHAEDKASGQVTVYNNYSSSPVKFVKNTRFQTPHGLIFRAPADIVVPGKSAAKAGAVTVTIVADQAGQQYNVGPFNKMTLPGLKGSAEYATVYAQSSAAFSGGLLGDKPGVSQADSDKALAAIRGRLETKARDAALALATDASIVFPDLIQITYEDQPLTSETGGMVRMHETAHVLVPVFPAPAFASAIAQSVSSDTENAVISIVPGAGYGARPVAATDSLGNTPLQFSLVGNATILWKVDGVALATALAGRDEGAFQTVVTGFPGIQEAHARIEPFWDSAFPHKSTAIKVKIVDPTK